MHFVYVLFSFKFNRSYVGMTKNIKQRLSEHNSKKNTSTKAFVPWEVVYTEEYNTQAEARIREKYLKTAGGRRWRKNNIRPRGATE